MAKDLKMSQRNQAERVFKNTVATPNSINATLLKDTITTQIYDNHRSRPPNSDTYHYGGQTTTQQNMSRQHHGNN